MSSAPLWAVGLAAGVSLALGGLLVRRRPEWTIEQRCLLFVLPGFGLLLLALCLGVVALMPFGDWNGARLSSSALLFHGYRLYYGPDEGPAMPTVYGPVSFLFFLPALLLRSLTGAILAAGLLNVMAIVAPLLVLHWPAVRLGGYARVAALSGFLFAVAALFAASPTHSMLSGIHVDAPAVGLGLLACALLSQVERSPSLARLCAVATLAVLSVWTKQIEVPLLLAVIAYAWLRHGARTALRLTLAVATVGTGLSAVFVIAFGFPELAFNLFSIGAGHLENFGAAGAPLSFLDLALECAPFLGGLALIAWLLRDEQEPCLERDWLLPLMAAAFLFPMSAIARSKLGAWENSYHALYYLVAAASLALAAGLRSPGAARRLSLLALAASMLLACLPQPGFQGFSRLASLADNPEEQALRFARAHRGQAYFPWNPLATAFAEGKLYHFDYAVLDRHLAGYPLSDAHIRAFLPADLRYVLFRNDRQDEAMLRFLPEFRVRMELPEMSGWLVYVRQPGDG